MSQLDKVIKPGSTIILDIDECLIHVFEISKFPQVAETVKEMCAKNPMLRRRKFNMILDDGEEFIAIKRPHLDKFLNFIFRYFEHVIIWSAGRKDYVQKVVEHLLKYDHQYPDLVFSRDEATYVDNKDYHKPISTIQLKHPELVDYKNTLFVDDKEDNFRNFPRNGIAIPRFDSDEDNPYDEKDDMLMRLVDWLMSPSVISSKDVRNLKKENIFKNPASHKDYEPIKKQNRFLWTPAPL